MKALKIYLIVTCVLLVIAISALLFLTFYPMGNLNNIGSDKANQQATKAPQQTSSPIPKDVVMKPVVASLDCLPSKFDFSWDIIKDNKPIKDFTRNYKLEFSRPEEYSEVEGVTCFRGNNYRNSASYGFADVKEQKLEKVWFTRIGYIDIWTGVGWNGQPVIIKWDEEVKKHMNLYPPMKTKSNLKEVIYATLDGKIYFLDLESGQSTRPEINVGYPHKGSVSVDARGYPLLYAGQGIDEKGGKRVPIGYRIFSLIDQKMLLFLDGFDPFALRRWGAFDSTTLIDKKTDTIVECGENGLIYTVKLNTKYDRDKGTISINPETIKYRYRPIKNGKLGVENSAAIYKNYAFFADNGGLLQCLDLNTLKPVWLRNVTDDTDSTIALEETNGSELSLYTACEVDRQGSGGSSYVRKINALTGDLLWEKAYKCSYDSNTNGGVLASPVIGKHDIKDLVIYNIAKTIDNTSGKSTSGISRTGKLVALDKNTGKEVWVIDLDFYSWSSPVDVYTKEGKSYIIVCDSGGNMFLIEGSTGKILDKIQLEANVEGSPAVYDNMLVVGTRGQKIWGIKIK